MIRRPPRSPLFPYPTLSRSSVATAVPPAPLGSVPSGDHHRHGPESPDGASRWSGGRVLVLNATFEPINVCTVRRATVLLLDRKSTRLNSSHANISYAVFCLK